MSASLWLLTAALALTGPDGDRAAPGARAPRSTAAPRTAEDRRRAAGARPDVSSPGKTTIAARGPDGTPAPLTIPNCQVTLIDVVDVAAQEAGVLTEVEVREGSEIKEGHLLAQVNDSKVQMAKKVAEAEHKV